MRHGRIVGMNKLFDPQVVFEYSLAVVGVMLAAGAVMWVGELLVRLVGLLV
jgi:hypothetical protein